ncbi:MAG: diaminopimelate epimerase [Chloroflexi bacterium]|nr:diaminopimelate epimerase [Chloroflexota bacterium]
MAIDIANQSHIELDKIGPAVENNSLFPNRINVHFVQILGRDVLKMRTWERGSGITLACGTGACAIAVAARLHGYIGDEVSIALPGGELKVSWPGQGEVILEGPVATVFEGDWPE